MSSWKKASKTNQKVHRERHQPESRQHLGLLEKKKDYKLRAKNFQEKDKALKFLYKKALDKNPDEFYHHMIRSKVKDGEHCESDNTPEYSKEQKALLETQDLKYISMKRNIEARKIEKLQADLHLLEAPNVKNKHIFFVEDESQVKNFDVSQRLGVHPSLLGRKINRPKLEDLEKVQIPDIDEEVLASNLKKKEVKCRELENRIEREKQLNVIQREIELKKQLSQKRLIKPKLVQKGTKHTAPIYKFTYERKK